jgi:hypothetical protein
VNPLPSLQYPSTSHGRAPSRLSSYHTRSPALRYSPVRRGDSIYYPATPVRSPTPLEEPIDLELIYHHGATTDSTLVPSSGSSRTHINPIVMLYAEYSFRQKSLSLLERDYSLVLSREQKRNTLQRSGRESTRLERESKKDSIVKRDFHPSTLLFLILYHTVGLEARLLIPFYVTVLLLFGLEEHLGYLHVSAKTSLVTSRIVPTLRRVPHFEAPIHVPLDRIIHSRILHHLTFVDHV